MKEHKPFSGRVLWGIRPVVGAAILLLFSFSAVLGATFDIDLNDSTIDDWQGVPVFLEDPLENDIAPAVNLINVSVATSASGGSGFSFLNFMVQTAANFPNSGHAVVASLDCDNDGIDREPTDYLIVFIPAALPEGTIDGTTLRMDGPANQGGSLPPDTGQRLNDRVEWGISDNDLEFPPPGNCSQMIGIRFMTASVAISGTGYVYTVLDSTELRQYNVPTAVELQEFGAGSQPSYGWLMGGAAGLAAAGLLVIGSWKRSRRDQNLS